MALTASLKKYTLAGILVVLSGIGAWMVLYTTSLGPGLSPDSLDYLGVADSLMEGHGFYIPFVPDRLSTPMIHFPPLYPLLLATMGFLGIAPVATARLINASCFALMISLVGFIVFQMTHGALVTSILGALLQASAYSMLVIHSWAWTEPLYILTGVAGLVLFANYLKNPTRINLVLSSILISVTFLVRYAGVAFVIAILLGLLLFKKAKPSRRLYEGATILGISFLPMLAWLYRNMQVAGSSTDRLFVYHPIGGNQLKQGWQTILRWLVPSDNSRLALVLFLVLAVLVLGLLISVCLQRDSTNKRTIRIIEGEPKPDGDPLVGILLLFLATYPAFLILSISLFDASTPLDIRILSPEFIPLLILVLVTSHKALDHARQSMLPYGTVSGLLILFGLTIVYQNVIVIRPYIAHYHSEGLQLQNKAWRESKILAAMESLPSDTWIYSNGPDFIYALTKRHSNWLPPKRSPSTTLDYSNYPDSLNRMQNELAHNHGVIVYFFNIDRPYLPSEAELSDLPGLRTVVGTDDGIILGTE